MLKRPITCYIFNLKGQISILTRTILNFSSAIMALLDMVEKQQIFITKTLHLQLKPQPEQNNEKGQRLRQTQEKRQF